MASIIDALVVTLGLDAKGVKSGAIQANASLKGVASGADNAGEAFRNLERNALAFFAVLTAGKSLKAFISDTTSSNVAAGNLARNLGTSVQSLTTWQKAAQAMGGTAEDVSGSMGSLVSQFQTIEGRRNLGMVFGQMGVRLNDANGHLRSMNDLLPDLAASAQKLGPQLFSALGSQAGFSQGFTNLLEQGPTRIRALYESLSKYAPTERDTNASAQLMEDWTKLTAQSQAFGRTIMTDLSPEVHHLFQFISSLVDKNQDWLRQDIDRYAQKFGDAIEKVDWRQVGNDIQKWVDYLRSIDWEGIGRGVQQFASGADAAAKAVGGWTHAVEILFGLWTAAQFTRVLANATALATASGASIAGLGRIGLAGAVGYGAHEALGAVDQGDQTGRWIDNHIPGAAAFDNFMSRFGVGRSYEQQDAAAQTANGIADRGNVLSSLDRQYNLPAGTMDAIWNQESSRGQNKNDSPVGAQGDFQIMPAVAKEAGIDPRNWLQAARYAAQRISRDRDHFGSISAAIAAYNAGGGRISQLMRMHGENWLSYAPHETQSYIGGVSRTIAHTNNSPFMNGNDANMQAAQSASIMRSPSAGTVNHNNVTIHAPGGNPREVTRAVEDAFRNLNMQSHQASFGLG